MQMIFNESGYSFDFSNSVRSYVAERIGNQVFPLVDFVIETEDNYLLIEVKNPDNVRSNEECRKDFIEKLLKDTFPENTSGSFKNTLLRMTIEGDFYRKPIICIFILEFERFAKRERRKLHEKISDKLPFFLNRVGTYKEKRIVKFEILTIHEFQRNYPCFSVKEYNL